MNNYLTSIKFSVAIEILIADFNLPMNHTDEFESSVAQFLENKINEEEFKKICSDFFETKEEENVEIIAYINKRIKPYTLEDTTHTELTIPPEQEPMVIPGEVVHNTPKEEVVVKEKLAPKEVEQKMEIEPEKEIDRSILLEEIENPTPAHQVIKKDQPTLKKPGIPLYEQKLQQSVRSAPQTQTINDPYKESIE